MITYGLELERFEERFFEDVNVGDEFSMSKTPYNLGKMAMWAAVHSDFCAGHFDYKTAMDRFGIEKPFAYGLQIAVYQSELMTDWMGPYGMLKKFKSKTINPTLDKDIVTCYGKVLRKYEKDGEGYVECETRAQVQDGKVVAVGSATVILRLKKNVK